MTEKKTTHPSGVAAAAAIAVAQTSRDGAWLRASVAFCVGLAFVLLAFLPSCRLLVAAWAGSETYSHGFLIAPVSAWLVWRMRGRLAALAPQAFLPALAVLAAALALWAVGELAEVNLVRYVAVISMVQGLALLCFGTAVVRAAIFPLAFLFFMVPLGEGLVPWLMEGTADATVAALRLTGVPVLREGLHFALPTGRWSVVEACSGLRYMVAALVLSTLFAHLNFRTLWKGAVFVLAALAVSIVANWARAYIVVMVGHLSDMRYGTGNDHVVYGWVFFGIVMLVVFWMGMRYSEDEARPVEGGAASPGAVPAASGTASGHAGLARTGAALAAFVALSATAMAGVAVVRDVPLQPGAAAQIASRIGAAGARPMDIQPAYSGASGVAQGELDPAGPRGPVQFYVAYFARQHETGEMVRFGNQVLALDDRRWSTFARRTESVSGEAGVFSVQERLVRSGTDERLMWSWYTVAGRSTAGDRQAKALTLRAMLSGQGDHSTVNVLLVPVAGDRDAARERLRAQARALDAAARAVTAGGG